MPSLNTLQALISDVCPIVGVCIVQPDDKTTWRIDFAPEATDAQKSAAEGVVRTFDLNTSDVPTSVTPRQARLALYGAGLLDQVEANVKAIGGPAQITWDYATTINRDDPLITQLGSSLNLTSAQIDALFSQAAAL